MGGGDAASGDEQVLRAHRQQAAIGNGVPRAGGEEIVAGAAALGVVDVDVVVARGDAVREMDAVLQILLCQAVFAVDHAALARANLNGR